MLLSDSINTGIKNKQFDSKKKEILEFAISSPIFVNKKNYEIDVYNKSS
jgi:hypothetical protein